MNWKTWAPLGVAIVLGLAAAKISGNLISRRTDSPADKFSRVVVARYDLPPGRALSKDDLTTGQIPKGVGTGDTFTDVSALDGRVLTTQITKGQAIVQALLAPKDSVAGLQTLVPEGMRAITVEVNEFTGLAGLVLPNCRVDLIATLHEPHSENVLSKTIVQNAKVTAVGQRMGNDGGNTGKSDEQTTRSVTLLVTPEEAEAIQLACTNSRPWLVLRSGKDNTQIDATGVSLIQLLGDAAPAARTTPVEVSAVPAMPAAATTRPADVVEPARRSVQVIRGSKETTVELELPPESPKTVAGY